jgi:hypothetical protein
VSAAGNGQRTSSSDLFGADVRFAAAFSHFLRGIPEAWRKRRIDRFRPVDSDTVERETTIQIRIEPSLLDFFLDSAEGKKLDVGSVGVSGGDEVTLLIPAIQQPKRLLLRFDSYDAEGTRLALLSRYDGARIAAGYILSRLLEGKPEPSAEELRSLRLILGALMFQNPGDLVDRINDWAQPPRSFPPRRPLLEKDLSEWIIHEGNIFKKNFGPPLATRLEPLVREVYRGGPAFDFPAISPFRELEHFANLSQLLLHGIRDLLKVVLEVADPLPGDANSRGLSQRRILIDSESKLLDELTTVLATLPRLTELFIAAPAARDELLTNLTHWAAYVIHPVRLGLPYDFTFKQTEILPAQYEWWETLRPLEKRWKRIWKTRQEYPLSNLLKDANTVHIEISIPDQEIHIPWRSGEEISRKSVCLVGRVPIQTRPRKLKVAPLSQAFSTVSHAPTGRLLHAYTSRQLLESQHEDEIIRYLRIFVPIRLVRNIFWGYAFAAVTFAVAAIFVSYTFVTAAIRNRSPNNLEAVVVVAAVAATLSIWLTNVQHERPIITTKLAGARLAFFCALVTLVIAPIVFMIREIV